MTFCLLVTANVGSIFEDPDGLLKLWVQEFLQTVAKLQPSFIALHCQEFGGKNYEESMGSVDEFIRTLLSSDELVEFEKIRMFLDEDFKSSDKYTALGNLYLVRKTEEAFIWDFSHQIFVPVIGKEVHSGNIENVSVKDKLKFPQDFYPEFKWSRKGFMKTRWLINQVAFDLINIHLFHDESNFVSLTDFPSPYAINRRKALEYTLNLISNNIFKDLPQFIFGDFNFRLDTKEVVRKLTNNSESIKRQSSKGDLSRLDFVDAQNGRQLSIERKHFFYSDQNFFIDPNNISWLLDYDKEPSHFENFVSELKIDFPPSYPFKEEITSSCQYMNTRCPSWCDRILMNKCARKLLLDDAGCEPKYDLMGFDVPMGDHKPVYLYFKLIPLREPSENYRRLLNSLLRHRSNAELETSHSNCTFSQSSHLRSISSLITSQTSEPVECFTSNQIDDQAINSNEDCSGNHIERIHPNHSLRCFCIKTTEDSNQADLAKSKALNHTKCNELMPVGKWKSIETNCHSNKNSFTDHESIELDGQTIIPTRRISTSRIREFKRYCLCCII